MMKFKSSPLKAHHILFGLYALVVLVVMSQTGLQVQANKSNPRLSENQTWSKAMIGRNLVKNADDVSPVAETKWVVDTSRLEMKSKEGELIWQFVLPDPKQGRQDQVIENGSFLIMVTSTNRVYNLHRLSGQVMWGTVVGEGSLEKARVIDDQLRIELLTPTRPQRLMVVTLSPVDGQMLSRAFAEFAGDEPELLADAELPGGAELAELSAAEAALAQSLRSPKVPNTFPEVSK